MRPFAPTLNEEVGRGKNPAEFLCRDTECNILRRMYPAHPILQLVPARIPQARQTDISGQPIGKPGEAIRFRGYQIVSVQISKK